MVLQGKMTMRKKFLFIIIEGDVCIVLFWNDFAFPSEHITAWNEKSQYEHNISSDLKANLKITDMVNFSTALFCFQPFFFFTKFSWILSTCYATQFIPFYQPLHFDSIKVNSVKNSVLSVNFRSLLLKEGAQIFPLWLKGLSVPSPSFPHLPSDQVLWKTGADEIPTDHSPDTGEFFFHTIAHWTVLLINLTLLQNLVAFSAVYLPAF